MTTTQDYESKTKELIDNLKSVCANYGMGNDGNEYKIIVQLFQFKLMNDKFLHKVKKKKPELETPEDLDAYFKGLNDDQWQKLNDRIGADTPKFQKHQLLRSLWHQQNEEKFGDALDNALIDLATTNAKTFSVQTQGGSKIALFDKITQYINDPAKRDDFARALIGKMTDFSFERIFDQKFDFYATIFEYLIKDYNKDGGGKYAEYYTPHAVAKIMAEILVPDAGDLKSVTCYDPSSGSGTLLMNLAHAIGEDRCAIYSQDISQKSSSMLRLNLILNNLVHSIPNIIEGNTILDPYHKEGNALRKFDFIVSNPPFKLDFSEYSKNLDTEVNQDRFFAGIPKVPAKKKDSMAIYLLFLQHIMYSLTENGKAAIVVPTGFITAQSGIDKKIRQKMVESKMLAGVVSMPSNIFATTGTNVSILFLDKTNKEEVVLIDASNLGTKIKEDKNQKTVLSGEEEDQIISTFNKKEVVDDFSVVVSYDDITAKNYSLSAGQYFEVKIEYVDITPDEFKAKMKGFEDSLQGLFKESRKLEKEIGENLKGLKYD